MNKEYPVKLVIDYPCELDKIKTLFRPILIIPFFILLVFLQNPAFIKHPPYYALGGPFFLTIPLILSIVFAEKYPRWWFDWNKELTNLYLRFSTYFSLMTDEYPSLEEEQNVHIEMKYPVMNKDIGRYEPLAKWFLAIPHTLILLLLLIPRLLVIYFSWFAILFTGKFPVQCFEFLAGCMRWSLRVRAYRTLLITDEYPPFSFN